MIRFITIFIFTGFLSSITFAQQLPIFTQYRENEGFINPAAIPNTYFVYNTNASFGASYRLQWIHMQHPPKTQTLHGEYMSTGNNVNILTGLTLINDQTGPTGFTGLYGRIGGVLSNDVEYGGLSAGLNLGVVQYRLEATELELRDENDILTTEDRVKIFPDVGFGIYAWKLIDFGGYTLDYFYGGLSVPQVFALDLNFTDPFGDIEVTRVRHYFAQAGLYHFFNNDNFIEPSIWLKYVPNTPINLDVNIRYQMIPNFWLGAGVSSQGNLHAEVGFAFGDLRDNAFRVGYGFDYSFSRWGPLAGTTHEINLSYAFKN